MKLRLSDDWSTATFDRPAVAAATGPFSRLEFLRAWWLLRGSGDLMLADSGSALMPMVSEDHVVRFVGEADLCDYRSPLGAGVAELAAALAEALPVGTRLQFDSLPAEAATPIVAGLTASGLTVEAQQHQLTAVVELPPTREEWMASLSKRQRHEVRRKLRRFHEAAGTPRLRRIDDASKALDLFVAMHRKASGDKGGFMDEAMERWFAVLISDVGAGIDFLAGDDETPLAAAIGFEDQEGYYLYNSSYEPEVAHLSPGIVLVTLLVTHAIHAQRPVFDFLKGDEPYKFSLGAKPRPLYGIDATIGGAS